MLRTLIIIIALALVYLIIKNRVQGKITARSKKASAKSEDTVRCLECKTFIPKAEAIETDGEHFCCNQHHRDWLAKQK